MQTSPCPNPRELQQLLAGRSPDDVADGLEKHLSDCERCSRAVATLNVEDGLVANLRAGAERPSPNEPNSPCRSASSKN